MVCVPDSLTSAFETRHYICAWVGRVSCYAVAKQGILIVPLGHNQVISTTHTGQLFEGHQPSLGASVSWP